MSLSTPFLIAVSLVAGALLSLAGGAFVWRRRRLALESEIAARDRLFQNVLAVTRASTTFLDLSEALRTTLDVAAERTGAESGSLLMLDEEEGVAHYVVARSHQVLSYGRAIIEDVMSRGLAGWVARERQTCVIDDTHSDDRWTMLPGEPDWRSVLCAPIATGSTLVGILTLTHIQPRRFGPAQQELVEAAAGQIALALRNAQIFESRNLIAQRQLLLYDLLRGVAGRLEARDVAEVSVRLLAERTRWPCVTVAFPAPESQGKSFDVISSATPGAHAAVLPIQSGIVGRAHRTGEVQNVARVEIDPDYVAGLPTTRSEVAVPIRLGDNALGVLDLQSTEPAAFRPDDVKLAESVAGALALALENARLYEELAAKHRRLGDLERRRDDLTHSLVHDIRNPLTNVSSALQALDIMSGPQMAERERRTLEAGQHAVARMSTLLDSILDLSRLEDGKMPLITAAVPLAPLVEDVLRLQRALADRKAITLLAHLDGEPTAWTDRALTERVLQNLVGNALKFSPEAGLISVEVERREGMVQITVRDSGPGIAPELQARLFQKFASHGDRQGSGLGLAFCRMAVEAMGGRIWVDSTAGHGAVFTFTLPAG